MPAKMTDKTPDMTPHKKPADVTTEDLRRLSPHVIDQRQQQIDPAGHHRHDPNRRPSTKQPGGKRPDPSDDAAPPETDAARDDAPEPG